MKTIAKYLIFSLLVLTGAFAQIIPPAEGNPAFTQQELDQMLAPIALYPDSLLSKILMAATYPLEVVEAARWSSANPGLQGDSAVQAVSGQNWDPSVKSLVAFPQVLQILDQRIDWTERLGDAFIAQQSQVMDTIQALRQKAQMTGNLHSNSQIQITQADNNIEVAPVDPGMVYVPYYDPSVVYGNWWWPDYPPVFWAPWPNYVWYGGLAWGIGIGVGADFFFGSWDWHHHRVNGQGPKYSGNNHPWQHDPSHRHGVPYRNSTLNRQFGRVNATSASRVEFRGHAPEASLRPGSPPVNRLPTESARMAPLPTTVRQPVLEPRAHAFENVGRGAEVHNFSARGNSSLSSSYSAPSRGPSRHENH